MWQPATSPRLQAVSSSSRADLSDDVPGVAVRLGLYSLLNCSSVVFEPQAPTPWLALQAGAAQQ